MSSYLFDLSAFQWILVMLCAVLVGMAKTGLSGAGLLIVPVFAAIFGGKPSVGLVLPMLVAADIFAVSYYHRHADWNYVIKLLPWAFAGIITGLLIGKHIPDEQFKKMISVIVCIGVVLMIWQDLKGKNLNIPDYWWFAAMLGFTGGFATMVGNAAGPIMALYLLSMRLSKNSYIGTGAWFFFIVNVIKLPLNAFVWKTIDGQSLWFDMWLVPAIILGAFAGIWIVKIIPERFYRIFIIVSTMASAIVLFL